MNPLALLFLIFIAVPLVEIYVLIQVGGVIGAPWTIALVVATAAIGVFLLRLQGLATVRRLQLSLASGSLPGIELVEGAILLFAAALLLTPGFVTDAIGFACLVPPLRQWAARGLVRRLFPFPPGGPNAGHRGPDVIEGQFRREDER